MSSSRITAAEAARAIRASLVDRSAAGERIIIHIDMSRPRRGVWMYLWSNLPGLTMDCGSREYSHALLPGWQYTLTEMRTEMIDDLDRLAATGERPKVATRRSSRPTAEPSQPG